jgi:hypothetical protein
MNYERSIRLNVLNVQSSYMLKSFVLVTYIFFSLTSAFAQAPFYQGKTITVIISTSPAGTGDLRIKALVPFLRKHIPGNPTMVLEYMDGGGGRKAANYMFRNVRPDGLTVGAMSSGVISLNIMRESGVMYDLDKFIYLGAPETAGHQTIYTRKELGLNNLENFAPSPACASAPSRWDMFLISPGASSPTFSISKTRSLLPATPPPRSTRRSCAANSMRGRMQPYRSCDAIQIGWKKA